MTSPDPTTPQTPPDPAAPRRLTRSSTDTVLGGVGGGLGRYFDVDPVLFRIGFAVAALAGGAGLLAYFALWLLVPDEHGDSARRPQRRELLLLAGGGVVLLVLAGLLPGAGFFIWPGFLGLIVLAALIGAILSGGPADDPRRRLLRASLITLAVAAAAFAGVAAAVGTAFGGGAVVAGIVIACGAGLVAGAFGPGRRWLLIPALVLAAPAAIVQAADLRVEGGVGEREYRPQSVTELRDVYRLGAGELVIDLRDLDFPDGQTDIRVEVGVGAVEIIVPGHVCASSRGEIGVGEVRIFGQRRDGVDVEWLQQAMEPTQAPRLFIDAAMDVGELIVRSSAASDHARYRAGDLVESAHQGVCES